MSIKQHFTPWGYYKILCETSNYKIKEIAVWPNRRLSLQSHTKRSEHWCIVQGEGLITKDDICFIMKSDQIVNIQAGTKHRIQNVGAGILIFIEIQTTDRLFNTCDPTDDPFDENDIERFEDDYGRCLVEQMEEQTMTNAEKVIEQRDAAERQLIFRIGGSPVASIIDGGAIRTYECKEILNGNAKQLAAWINHMLSPAPSFDHYRKNSEPADEEFAQEEEEILREIEYDEEFGYQKPKNKE